MDLRDHIVDDGSAVSARVLEAVKLLQCDPYVGGQLEENVGQLTDMLGVVRAVGVPLPDITNIQAGDIAVWFEAVSQAWETAGGLTECPTASTPTTPTS